jgi:hypothetical protein
MKNSPKETYFNGNLKAEELVFGVITALTLLNVDQLVRKLPIFCVTQKPRTYNTKFRHFICKCIKSKKSGFRKFAISEELFCLSLF